MAQALSIVAESETNVETMVEQLLQLLRFASETVPDPRLSCTAMQAQNVIDSANTVEDKGAGETLA